MADDLDSFFAKKDKKGKNKKKAIVLTIEDNFDEEEEPVSQKKANVDLNKLKGFIEVRHFVIVYILKDEILICLFLF